MIGTRRVGGGGRTEEIKHLAMKTRYSFELWDLFGTSYAPFPLDTPWVDAQNQVLFGIVELSQGLSGNRHPGATRSAFRFD